MQCEQSHDVNISIENDVNVSSKFLENESLNITNQPSKAGIQMTL